MRTKDPLCDARFSVAADPDRRQVLPSAPPVREYLRVPLGPSTQGLSANSQGSASDHFRFPRSLFSLGSAHAARGRSRRSPSLASGRGVRAIRNQGRYQTVATGEQREHHPHCVRVPGAMRADSKTRKPARNREMPATAPQFSRTASHRTRPPRLARSRDESSTCTGSNEAGSPQAPCAALTSPGPGYMLSFVEDFCRCGERTCSRRRSPIVSAG
jgi:hypothetical protein